VSSYPTTTTKFAKSSSRRGALPPILGSSVELQRRSEIMQQPQPIA
jgi:hypothetical protein